MLDCRSIEPIECPDSVEGQNGDISISGNFALCGPIIRDDDILAYQIDRQLQCTYNPREEGPSTRQKPPGMKSIAIVILSLVGLGVHLRNSLGSDATS